MKKDRIVYYPWSDKILEECLLSHDQGKLATLDMELTAKCTKASCIYCDSRPEVGSRHTNELNLRETTRLLKEGKRLGLKWIYCCGFGEPLEDLRFKNFVQTATEQGIRISLFTNGILIDRDMARWLHANKVCLILKLDSLEEDTFDKVLGKKGSAKKIYEALELLLAVGYGRNNKNCYTDLAFSIVPTRLNVNEIETVIKFAKDNNIFSSIGELEQAGRTLEGTTYKDLALDDEEILALKQTVETLLWKGYTRPICPAIITGVHIDNVGNCIVDRETGLNCKWFLLKEPSTKVIGNIRRDDLATMFQAVREYRRDRFHGNGGEVRECELMEYVFGGCGGSPRKIIKLAREHL